MRLVAILAMVLVALPGCGERTTAPEATFDVATVLSDADTAGFARAEQPRAFRFPEDHGPHPSFRTEWWYFTGNLATPEGRRFGYELAIFRQALAPDAPLRTSRFATRHAYMAHFALTDVAQQRFHAFERLARGANGLAGAQARPFRVWVEDWSVAGGDFPWQVRAADGDIAIELALTPAKPPALQGERGLSRKGARPGNASYYYSYTRMETRGHVATAAGRFPVTGTSWMDREWSTSALEGGQVGWDWFGLQLADGYDLMYYRLRERDGSASTFSLGALVDPAGNMRSLAHDEVTLEPLAYWESPRGARYPTRWRLAVKPADLALEIDARVPQQELDVSVRYWEGAVALAGTHAGRAVTGAGYAELTGYGARPARAP